VNRKLEKKELDLWKEITKEDIKINNYISEDMIEENTKKLKTSSPLDKKPLQPSRVEQKEIIKNHFVNQQKPQVNKRMKAKFERGLIRPEATLDLHGYNRVEAQNTLESFIKTCIYEEKRCILIVTGKRKSLLGSKSILRELVPMWLNEQNYFSLVLAHCYAVQKDGGDGARYVLLRKKEAKK